MNSSERELERLLTIDELAIWFKVSEATVRRWVKAGKLKGFQPGGRKGGIRFRLSAVNEMIMKNEKRI